KSKLLSYIATCALFLALLTPLFLQPNEAHKAVKTDDAQTIVLVEETELAEKEDGQSFGKRISDRGPFIRQGYGWSD
ncbi:MAG: hypothetical protein AAF490_30660, partial [Chloroflexota bacterium]